MKLRSTPLMRLLMAMTLIVAACLLASPGAQAHAGHDHASRHAAAAAHQQHVLRPVAELASAMHAAELADAKTQGADASPWQSSDGHADGPCCGCCHSCGAGCCAAWLPSIAVLTSPHTGRLGAEWGVAEEAGITPDALPEPPKSLV